MDMEMLTHFIDSLSLNYTFRQNTQLKEFLQSKVYVERKALPSYAVRTDDYETPADTGTFDPKALYDSLTVNQKMEVLTKSVETMKDATSFLASKTETMKTNLRSIGKYEVDWHKKLTIPFACLVFFLIGAPLGAIIRKGGLGTPAVISVFFFVVWYVISLSGEKLVEEGLVGSIAGMWASSFILLPVGLFLTYKASNDSVILNIDTYLAFFRKIKDWIYKITFQGKSRNPDNKPLDDDEIQA
jgi:lipopolysaccharide export system permease protein